MYNKRQDIFTGDIELFSLLFSFNQNKECLVSLVALSST